MPTDALDTNLLRTPRKGGGAPADGGKNVPEAPGLKALLTRKRILKIAAYTLFFLWSMVFFTFLKIPNSAVANFLLNTLNQQTAWQWQAEKIHVRVFPFPHLYLEKLSMDPKFGVGVSALFDELRVYPNPIYGLGGSFSGEAYHTKFDGHVANSGGGFAFEASDADLAKITPIARSGVDLKGLLTTLAVRLSMPNQRAALAEGDVQLKARNIELDPSNLGLPVVLPLLKLGDVEIQGTVSRGQLKIEKFKIGGAGKDLDITITPASIVVLSDVAPNTRYDLHLLVKPSPAIEKAVPGLGAMMATWSTLKPDGSYAMRLQGTLAAPAFPVKD